MRVLLDTCEFLWLVTGDPRLPSSVAAAVRDPANEVYLSTVSFWEISVKHALGKLPLPQPPEHYVPLQRERHRIASLALDEAAVARLNSLPPLSSRPLRPDARLPGVGARADAREFRSHRATVSGDSPLNFSTALFW